jgi:hypothetical protein
MESPQGEQGWRRGDVKSVEQCSAGECRSQLCKRHGDQLSHRWATDREILSTPPPVYCKYSPFASRGSSTSPHYLRPTLAAQRQA